ncbi:fibronectin type III domain-containing protein [bacterium BD-1]|nr:fibronectin type III domain-containing protein [Ottowia caeni]
MTPAKIPARLALFALALFASAVGAQDITTVAGSGQPGPVETTEPVEQANFERPTVIARTFRTVWVADRFRIRSVYPPHVNVIIGNGTEGFEGDGGRPDVARIHEPGGIVFRPGGDTFGIIYFTDPVAHRIRVLDQNGVLHTFAGDGTAADTGDGGTAIDAQLDTPRALVRHGADLYVATRHRVRRIQTGPQIYSLPTGNISTYAGTGEPGFSGDGGPARAARFNGIGAMATGPGGELYVFDSGNQRVRRIDTNGIVTTVAGNGTVGGGGLGGPATQAPVSDVTGLAVDSTGRLYIAQGPRHRVLRVSSNGTLHLYAGTGTAGFSGDGGPANQARLNWPADITIDDDDRLWISDRDNLRIRRVDVSAADGATVPAAPGKPRASSANTAAFVEVDPPDDGGSPILGYVYEATPADVAPVDIPYEFWTVDGLTNGRSYTFTVRARNAVGLGPASPASNPVVPSGSVAQLTMPEVIAEEGDDGERTATVVFRLDRPAALPVEFQIETNGGTATPGVDYLPVPRTPLRIEVGQSQVTLPLKILGDTIQELDETITLAWDFGISGAYRGGGSIRPWNVVIRDDDMQTVNILVRDEQVVLAENSPATVVPVVDNDEVERARLAGGSLTILQAPTLGTAAVDNRATPASAGDDHIVYTPRADTAGEDLFSYRLCTGDGTCDEGVVTVLLRPTPRVDKTVTETSGSLFTTLQGLRALPSATYAATPLVAPVTETGTLAPDPTRFLPWDNDEGRHVMARAIPAHADAAPRKWKLLVEAGDRTGPVVDLYVGLDTNDDGRPSPDELRCTAATVAAIERCELSVEQPPGEVLRWWAIAHNRGIPAAPFRLDAYEVPVRAGDGSLFATGPGRVAAVEPLKLRLGWNDPTLLPGETRVGYVSVSGGGGRDLGSFPVRLQREEGADAAIVLQPGVGKRLALASGRSHPAIVVDVPLGATRLTVSTQSAQNVDLWLTPWDAPPEAVVSKVGPVPSAPLYAAYGPTGNETLRVEGAALKPGRWYLVPRNGGATPATLEIRADIEANTPAVRPGSYFNADRSGHGLFLYPAGNQWAGLWYTYLEDGTSTWYYLQAPAPGIDGLWSSPVFRAAWDGGRNVLTEVGRAVVTPTGGDTFNFSYTVDGVTGGEPMAPLGRGCPTLGGIPVDASSHWFNPARAGAGYSVQLFPDYEFIAAFVYDARGEPRFLAGERQGFGGGTANLALEQLSGFCPTCTRVSEPERFDVGVIGRTFSQGQLRRISLDAAFTAGVGGSWSADEEVQLLGGAGTTQGCAP